ncbi:hypothetical protein COBT_001484 [Conglomerata obtusa]
MTNNNLAPTRYTQLNQLGQGRYASVFLALNDQTGAEVAIKIINKQKIINDNPMFIKNELAAMKRLEHCENVIKYIDFYEDCNQATFVLEYLNGFNLQREYYERHCHKHNPMTFKEKQMIMLKIVNGLKNLHDMDIYHGDLKPENIMLVNDDVFIIDFGCAFICEKGVCAAREFYRRGTPGFSPPEKTCFSDLNMPIFPEKVDVWALCCVFYYLHTGQLPFECDLIASKRSSQTVADLYYNKENVPEKVVAICEKVFIKDLNKRLNLREFEQEIEKLK